MVENCGFIWAGWEPIFDFRFGMGEAKTRADPEIE